MEESGHGIVGRESELARGEVLHRVGAGGTLGPAPGGSGRDRQDDPVGTRECPWREREDIGCWPAALSRIFHKLGVRSRTELTRRITTTHGQQTTFTKADT